MKVVNSNSSVRECYVTQDFTDFLITNGKTPHVAQTFCCFPKRQNTLLLNYTGDQLFFNFNDQIEKTIGEYIYFFSFVIVTN